MGISGVRTLNRPDRIQFPMSAPKAGGEHWGAGRVLHSEEKTMTYVEPTPPGTPQPEIQPEPTPQPEIDPADAPDEMPPMEPGGGGEGDSRPYAAV
jgi:hypothetical protein